MGLGKESFGLERGVGREGQPLNKQSLSFRKDQPCSREAARHTACSHSSKALSPSNSVSCERMKAAFPLVEDNRVREDGKKGFNEALPPSPRGGIRGVWSKEQTPGI